MSPGQQSQALDKELLRLQEGDSWESLGQQADQTSQSQRKSATEYSLEGLVLELTLWPSDAKNQFIGKDPVAGKDWGQEEKEVAEDEMVGWGHWLNEHEFEQTQGDSEGQGSLACYSPSGHKELDTA